MPPTARPADRDSSGRQTTPRPAARSAPRWRCRRPAPGAATRLPPGPLGLLVAAAVLVAGQGAAARAEPAGAREVVSAAAAGPAAPVAQPAAIEGLSPYLPQVSCASVSMPGSVSLGNLLRAGYPGTSYSVARACGSDGIASEHYEGRAVDWFVSRRKPAQLAQASAMIAWLLAPDAAGRPYAAARRLGVMYLIWDDRIWGAYRAGDGWRPYSICGAHQERAWDTACHRDHVHISLSWAGAARRTSFWTGRVAAVDYGPCRPVDLNWAAPYTRPRYVPCPDHRTVVPPPGTPATIAALYRGSGAQLGPGASGPLVPPLQRALGVPADGSFGALTAAAVSAFRVAHGLRAGQVVDAATWRALLGTIPGTAGGTTPAPPPPSPPSTSTAAALPAAWTALVLTYDASGPAVTAVQRLLRVTPTGWFGPRTQAAVKAFQSAHAIPTTGNVGPRTWAALAKLARARR